MPIRRGPNHLSDQPMLLTGQVPWNSNTPLAEIKETFGDEPLSFLALFVSPLADFGTTVAEAEDLFPDTNVAACTTAGEISAQGYDEGCIIAVGFPKSGFASTSLMIVSKALPEFRMVSTNSFCSSPRLVSASRSAIPTIPFIGVRISWLMLARNADFARLAASA